MRRVGNIIFANLVSLISARHITDSASGMRVFKKSILERIYPLPDGLNLTPVMSTRALHERLKMIEVPIPYSERAGRSKLNVMRDGMRFAQSIVWTALTYNPVRPLGSHRPGGHRPSLCWSACGSLVQRLQGVTTLTPFGVFALFTAVVLGVVGVSLFIARRHVQLPGVPLLPAADPPGPLRQAHLQDAARPPFLVDGPGRHRRRHRPGGREPGLGRAGLADGSPVVLAAGGRHECLIGLQLLIGWFIMRVLEELSQRDRLVDKDMRRKRPSRDRRQCECRDEFCQPE